MGPRPSRKGLAKATPLHAEPSQIVTKIASRIEKRAEQPELTSRCSRKTKRPTVNAKQLIAKRFASRVEKRAEQPELTPRCLRKAKKPTIHAPQLLAKMIASRREQSAEQSLIKNSLRKAKKPTIHAPQLNAKMIASRPRPQPPRRPQPPTTERGHHIHHREILR